MIKILLAAILVAIAAVALFATRVTKIEVKESSCISAGQLNLEGKIIFTISENSLKKDLKEKFPCLTDLKLKKSYPSKLIIEPKTENPVARIANTEFLITTEGFLVPGKSDSLPQLFLPPGVPTVPNEKITDGVSLSAVKLASLLVKSDFHATNIRILDSQDIAVYDASQTVAVFSTKGSLESQVDSLQQVLAKAKIGDDKIAKIDLRFEKPVITVK